MKIKTIGDLRKCIEELSDDFNIDFRIHNDKDFSTMYFEGIDFDEFNTFLEIWTIMS